MTRQEDESRVLDTIKRYTDLYSNSLGELPFSAVQSFALELIDWRDRHPQPPPHQDSFVETIRRQLDQNMRFMQEQMNTQMYQGRIPETGINYVVSDIDSLKKIVSFKKVEWGDPV